MIFRIKTLVIAPYVTYRVFLFLMLVAPHFSTINAAGASRLALSIEMPGNLPRFSAVSALVSIRNEGSEPLILANFAAIGELEAEIRQGASQEMVYHGALGRDENRNKDHFVPPVTVKPQGTERFTAVLACRWSPEGRLLGALFDTPGDYVAIFRYTATEQRGTEIVPYQLVSSPVHFKVVEIEQQDTVAFHELQQLTCPACLLDPEAALRDLNQSQKAQMLAGLQSYITHNPSSPWTPLAHYSLSKLMMTQISGTTADQIAINRALESLDQATGSPDFPYRSKADALRVYLNKMLGKQRSAARMPQRAQESALSPGARQNIEGGLHELAVAIETGDTNKLEQILATDFVKDGRMNRSAFLAALERDRAKLGGGRISVQPQLVSALNKGSGYVVEARFEFESNGKHETQYFTIEGDFTPDKLLLKSWNMKSVTGQPSENR